ncbi:RmlC-like cupin domain-containing protein [Cladochytrium replicatum]|nr:RmlC-like cupin domain-containing protein [Cladochytrium replicatum]
MLSFSYPHSNDQLVKHYRLEPHPEGGFYVVTWGMKEQIPSPFAENNAPRVIATSIFYLLAHPHPSLPTSTFPSWSPSTGVFHLNKSATMHVHHCGRTRYTLISAKAPLGKGLMDSEGMPLTKVVTMGEDFERGEVRQLVVEGGWWKVSEVPDEDIAAVESGMVDAERVGALITEVVTPGFHWDDHTYLTVAKLRELFAGHREQEFVDKYRKYVKEQ